MVQVTVEGGEKGREVSMDQRGGGKEFCFELADPFLLLFFLPAPSSLP